MHGFTVFLAAAVGYLSSEHRIPVATFIDLSIYTKQACTAQITTVEPLLKDTLNKEHLSKGQALWSLQDHGNTILPLKEDNFSITVKLAGHKVSVNLEVSLYYVQVRET